MTGVTSFLSIDLSPRGEKKRNFPINSKLIRCSFVTFIENLLYERRCLTDLCEPGRQTSLPSGAHILCALHFLCPPWAVLLADVKEGTALWACNNKSHGYIGRGADTDGGVTGFDRGVQEGLCFEERHNGMRSRPHKLLGEYVIGEGPASSETLEWKLT